MELAFLGFKTFLGGFALRVVGFFTVFFPPVALGAIFLTFFEERTPRNEKGERFLAGFGAADVLTRKNFARPPTAGAGAIKEAFVLAVVELEAGKPEFVEVGAFIVVEGGVANTEDIEDALSLPVVLLPLPPEKNGGIAELLAIALCLKTFLDTAKNADRFNIIEENRLIYFFSEEIVY